MKNMEHEFEHITVSYSPDCEYLKIIWKGTIDAEKMQHGYQLALKIFETQKIQRCLIDMTRRTLDENGTEPVITVIFSHLLSILKNPLFVALILKPEAYFMITDHFHYEHLRQDDNHFVIIKHFLNQEAAEEWLSTAAKNFLHH